MSKPKKDMVWELIQSMTKAEKRQFKLYAQRMERNQTSKFLALFDLMNQLPAYNEAKVFEKKIVSKSQLSNVKAHLYKQLLASLRINAASKNNTLQLREQMDNAIVLYDKGLYLQALRILSKVKTRALENEHLTVLYEIIEFEKIIESQFITRSSANRADLLCAESTATVKRVNAVSSLANTSLQLYNFLLTYGYVKNEAEREMIDAIFYKEALIEKEHNNLSFIEKLWYYKTNLWYNFIIQDYLTAYKYARRWVDLFDVNPLMKINHPIFYLKGNHYLMEVLFFLWQPQKHEAALNKLLQNIANENFTLNGNSETLAFLYARSNQLNEAILSFNYKKGVNIINRIEKELPEFIGRLDEHHIVLFYYKFACIHFGLENYDACENYLNKLLANKNLSIGKHLTCNAKFLRLICYYDGGDYNRLGKALLITYKYLHQLNDLNEVYLKIMQFIKKILKAEQREIKQLFSKLRDELVTYTTHPYEKRTFYYLDIISWLDSKITGKPMLTVMQQRRNMAISRRNN